MIIRRSKDFREDLVKPVESSRINGALVGRAILRARTYPPSNLPNEFAGETIQSKVVFNC